MRKRIQNIHFVGIGGSGMCGIAEVMLNLGYTVTGSDLSESSVVQRLREIGAQVWIGHHEMHVANAHAIVTSTAVRADNPEVVEARRKRIPVVARAVMLAELMRLRKGIAIAGTHGKTTTTSLVASILAAGNMDPTFVIGGKLNAAGSNARLGAGKYIVAEADESDASFLSLTPESSVVTNIDVDHMATYDHSIAKLRQTFVDFLHRMPFYGVAYVCIDDAGVQAIADQISRTVVTYGLSEVADVRAVDVEALAGGQMRFVVKRKIENELPDLPVLLNLAGVHNVRNALAAIAIATDLEVPDEAILSALKVFRGVGRRFQQYGEVALPAGGKFLLIDDYGHHPVEMAATISAVRGAFPGRRLTVVFQPHRYSRTRDYFEDFVKVLSQADHVVLADVYAAGEESIVAADGRALTRAVRVAGKVEPVFVENMGELPDVIMSTALDGDVVLTIGAGSIGRIPAKLVDYVKDKK
ncbi:MAG: UDP-N-acetylmuramate--L-alanine ligase [Saezia sp.]